MTIIPDQAHNVSIVGKGVSLRAGGQHEFSCVAFGSRPAAAITWWFDQTIVKDGMEGVHVVSEGAGLGVLKPCTTKPCFAQQKRKGIHSLSRDTEHVKSVSICGRPQLLFIIFPFSPERGNEMRCRSAVQAL